MSANALADRPVLGRAPQLDGLRACAVIAVIASHTLNGIAIGDVALIDELGSNAVYFFFVLSGFLISRGLLRQRAEPFGPTLARFYLARALRLLPAYYLALGFALLVGVDGIGEELPWHALQASNLLFALYPDVGENSWAGHFWSLSVEEQFYLVVPAILLTCAGAGARIMAWAMIGLGVYAWSPLNTLPDTLSTVAILDSLDSLGVGVLLALLEREEGNGAKFTRAAMFALPVGLGAFALGLAGLDGAGWAELVWHECANIVYAAIVWLAFTGIRGAPGALLCSSPMVRIGHISYMMYVVHNFLIAAYWEWWPILAGTEPFSYGRKLFVVTLAGSIIFAEVSWRLIEQPIDRWRRRARLDDRKEAALT